MKRNVSTSELSSIGILKIDFLCTNVCVTAVRLAAVVGVASCVLWFVYVVAFGFSPHIDVFLMVLN